MSIAQTVSTPTAKLSEDIRVWILRQGAENGGVRKLCEKAGIKYSTTWNQINRQHGPLVAIIPPLIVATGDPYPLDRMADVCGRITAPKPKYLRTRREIHRQGNGLAIAVGKALDVIEQALIDGLINSLEQEQIRGALCRVCSNALEIGESVTGGRFLRKGSRE